MLALVVSAVLYGVDRSEQETVTAPEYGLAPAFSAPYDGEGEFANILITAEDASSLEQAYLLVNGEPRGSFAAGELRVRVYDGDILSLDCLAYGRELSFRLDILSASVDSSYLPSRFSCCQEVATVGFVVIR